MTYDKTLAIIKPDAFGDGRRDDIKRLQTESGFKVLASRPMKLTRSEAESFYHVHRDGEYFGRLIDFMTSGFVEVQLLQKEGAVVEWRRLLELIRMKMATSKMDNCVHGSDTDANAMWEARFFFGPYIDCTRFVLVNHARPADHPEYGRVVDASEVFVEHSIQDDGRTAKLFLSGRK